MLTVYDFCTRCEGQQRPVAPGYVVMPGMLVCAHVNMSGEPCGEGASYTPEDQAANLEELIAALEDEVADRLRMGLDP